MVQANLCFSRVNCTYVHIYINISAYVCLYVSEMNHSTNSRNKKEELGLFYYYRYSHNPRSDIMFFKSRHGLVVNINCKL